MELPVKNCQTCGKALRGRSDKKFCDDYCRNSFNNQLKATDNNLVRNINNALKKNRRILQSLLSGSEQMARTSREQLSQAGFHFKYFTHLYTNKRGGTYFYCYEYGYLPLGQEGVLVVKKKALGQ